MNEFILNAKKSYRVEKLPVWVEIPLENPVGIIDAASCTCITW